MVPAFNGSIYEEIFGNICSLFRSPNFMIMFVPTQVAWFPLVCVLKRADIRAIILHSAKIFHPDSFMSFANLAAKGIQHICTYVCIV